MYLVKQITQPNGAQTMVHRIARVEIVAATPMMPHRPSTVMIQIHSFVDENENHLAWQDSHPMDLADFSATNYPANVIGFLTAVGGPLEGAGVVDSNDTELSRAQKFALARVAKLREDHIAGGFTVEGVGTFESDALSIRNITGKAATALVALNRSDTEWATPWKLHDNSMIELDAEGMTQVGEALDAHITACYARSWELKALIAGAEDTAALGAIDLQSNWP